MLRNRRFIGGVWVDSADRFTNTNGDPLDSVEANGDGRLFADTYYLAFANVIPGTSADVSIVTDSPNNIYRTSAPIAVVLDGATEHDEVIPGLTLIFSADAGFTNAWTATINAGDFIGTLDAFGAGAGTPTAGIRNQVVNDGSGAVSNAKARLLPIVKWRKTTGSVFSSIEPFAEGATEKVAGGGSAQVISYVLSILSTAGAGGAKTAVLQVDGVTFPAASLEDLSDGTLHDGSAVKAVSGHEYRVVAGDLTGLVFSLDSACAAGDDANVAIWESRYVQIAPDAGGVAGAYGTADVTLTQSGQAAGTIQPGQVAYFWRRLVVPAGANSESNPYPADVALEGTETGAAGI